jgi:secreted trypsin-like serine protease
MRSKLAALVGVALFAVAAPAHAITNGVPDGNAHPNVAAIVADVPGLGRIPLCSGSLLTPSLVLTAGHCVDDLGALGIAPADVAITFDSDTKLAGGQSGPDNVVAADWTAAHPDLRYGGQSTVYNDVGVIHLAEPVQGIPPVTLPPIGWLSGAAAGGGLRGKYFTTVGFGLSGLDRSINSPQVGIGFDGLRRVSTAPFASLNRYHLHLLENTAATGGGGTCNGDSGGPAFPGWDGAPSFQVALTTSGDPGCRAESRRQRLDTAVVQDWLSQEMVLP